jgi:hypothetical protein
MKENQETFFSITLTIKFHTTLSNTSKSTNILSQNKNYNRYKTILEIITNTEYSYQLFIIKLYIRNENVKVD